MSSTHLSILVCCYFVVINSAQQTPIISRISPRQAKDIGDDLELECFVQYATANYSVLWIKLDIENGQYPVLISSESTLYTKDPRFSLRQEPESETSKSFLYALQIKGLQEIDAGVYQCQIAIGVSNRILAADIGVSIRLPPVISAGSNDSLVVAEGQSVSLECYGSGFPLPRILWRRNDNVILPNGGTHFKGNVLRIFSAKKEDRGHYFCEAENTIGRSSKRNIFLEVEFSPIINLPRPKVGQALHYDMSMICQVEAYPAPMITWLKNDAIIQSGRDYRISNFVIDSAFMTTTLHVLGIRKEQFGAYICNANNKLGFSEAELELQEIEIPNINYAVQLQISSSSRLIGNSSRFYLFVLVPNIYICVSILILKPYSIY